MEKVNQKAIRSPSLRLRFGRRSDPDFPPNFVSIPPHNHLATSPYTSDSLLSCPDRHLTKRDLSLYSQDLLNEDFQREDPQQMLSPMDSVYQQKRFLGFARQERKPARLRWGRSAPGQFSSVSQRRGDDHVSPNFTNCPRVENQEEDGEELMAASSTLLSFQTHYHSL